MFLISLLYLLVSFAFILNKESLSFATPFFLVGLRLLVAGGLLLIYYKFFRKQKIAIKNKDWVLFLIIAVFGAFITNSFDLWGLQYLYAAKVSLIYMLSPFFGAIISYFFLKEPLSKSKFLGLFLGLGGLFVLLLGGKTGKLYDFSLADAAVIVAAFTTVIGWTAMKALVDDRSYSPILVNGISLSIGGCLSFCASLILESWNPLPVTNALYCMTFVIAAALVAHIISYNLYAYLLKRYTVVFMTFASLCAPLFTAVLAYLFLGERVPQTFFISLLMIFAGMYFFYKDELRG
jgi:drug/metabolite transporter (DMT)-like permease